MNLGLAALVWWEPSIYSHSHLLLRSPPVLPRMCVHHLCPEGENSWCFYKKVKAEGMQWKSHMDMTIYFRVPDDMKATILSIYDDLTSTSLLERCFKGQTQNVIESLHSKFWSKYSKVKFEFASLTKVIFGMRVIVIQHNFGCGDELVLTELGLFQTVHGKETTIVLWETKS